MRPRTPEEIEECFREYLGQPITANSDGQVSICCPFHDDHSPSFSLNITTGLWKCHAGCGEGNIEKFQEMCLALKDKQPRTTEAIATPGTLPLSTDTIYQYVDANGGELYQIVRSDAQGK